ncbi:MAG: hypothetical protein AAFZ80_06380 [Cyanobacteria bacterium P01_A01_bin.105]
MLRLLNDLNRVRYIHTDDSEVTQQGEGIVVEAFNAANQATLVANRSLYLNVLSFDYLELGHCEDGDYFDLIQDRRCLRLIPLSNPLQEQTTRSLNAAALEAVVTEALNARWDACLDAENGNHFSDNNFSD